MNEKKFFKILAIASSIIAVPQLFWAAARFGGLFFAALAFACPGQYAALTFAGKSRFWRGVSRLGRLLFGLFLLSFIIVQGIILLGMQTDAQADEADVILVLGARVYENGNPSATLAARLDTALEYLNTHPNASAMLCGGQGENEPFPEAHAMRDYLLARGAAPERLMIEDASNNTIQNIANAKAILDDKYESYSTAVITSDFHLARARRLTAHAGLDPYGIPSPTPYPAQRLAVHLREYGSIMGLVLTGRW